MFKKSFNLALVAILILMVTFTSYAKTPQLISYQGLLTDKAGNPINDNCTIQFRIYNSQTEGAALWSETQKIMVTNGIFNVMLGSVKSIPYSVFDGNAKFLSFQVGDDPEMNPRKPLASVGYSFRAYEADKLDGMDASSFMQTMNGVPCENGNIELVAGDNITIASDKKNKRITISAAGGTVGKTSALSPGNTLDMAYDEGGPGAGRTITADAGQVHIAGQNGLRVDNGVRCYADTACYAVYGEKGANSGYIASKDYGAFGGRGDSYGFMGSNTYGVYGKKGDNYGFLGSNSYGAFGRKGDNYGWLGGSIYGVYGRGITYGVFGWGNNYGVFGRSQGSNKYGVYGENGSNYGFLGGNSCGAYGRKGNIYGYLGSSYYGVYGNSNHEQGSGVYGYSNGNHASAVYGRHSQGFYGKLGCYDHGIEFPWGCGVYGRSNSSRSYGYLGSAYEGAFGYNQASVGVRGNSSTGYGVYGYCRSRIRTISGGYAGYFDGHVHITGELSKSAGTFKIDHPLDPENKYLCHSFVESSDMMNIYNGNVKLDGNGEAWVELPEWFGALNKDFRYQLTCIGGFAQVYVAEKISQNRFKIAGDTPGIEVSWQVTGIRQDAYANANRIQVEVEKKGSERGKYLHPKEHGVSETLGIDYTERQKMEQERQRMEALNQKNEQEMKAPTLQQE